MKPSFSKTSFAKLAALMMMLIFTVSCSENENESNQDTPTRVELARINGYQDITLPEKVDWQVIESPDWAVPMQQSGDANTALQLFVETNDEETDRTGKLVVKLASGKTRTYDLCQIGTLRDGDNASLTVPKDLQLTYGVGYSLNVLDNTSASTFKYAVRRTSPYNFAKLLAAFKDMGAEDALSSEDYVTSNIVNIIGESTSEIAMQLALKDSIDSELKAFQLSVDGYYNNVHSSHNEYSYAIQKIQYTTSSRHVDSNLLKKFAQDDNKDIYQSTFRNIIKKLKANPNDTDALSNIVKSYGTHLIIYGVLGGELNVALQMKKSNNVEGSDISIALELSSKVINGEGDFEKTNKETTVASNTTVSLTTYGGRNVYTIAPETSFDSYMNVMKDTQKLNEWLRDIQNGNSLALIGIKAIPIWDLMPSEEARNALHNYIVEVYQPSVFGKN